LKSTVPITWVSAESIDIAKIFYNVTKTNTSRYYVRQLTSPWVTEGMVYHV
jgi:hypothetical protein